MHKYFGMKEIIMVGLPGVFVATFKMMGNVLTAHTLQGGITIFL